MIQYESVRKAMGVDIAVSKKMARAIYKWTKMYMNEASWLSDDVKGLNIPAAICSEIARLVTMESEILITGNTHRSDLIEKSLHSFFTSLPVYTEYACSAGGCVFKPYLSGDGIAVDVVKAGDFFPVAFDSAGDITSVIFPEFKQVGKKLYTRLEYQSFEDGEYIIQNRAFVSRKASVKIDEIVNLGQEIDLSEVPEWADIEPEVRLNNADRTLFSYFKIPLANNIDVMSPLGISVYERAVNQIRDADEQYGATLWEFKSKETAIQAANEFFRQDRQGNPILPKGKERMYRAMGSSVVNSTGSPFFNVYSPEIRDESFFNGYNRIIQKVEFNSGLAYGTLSDPQTVDKTAEEIKTSKQRSYATVKAIQNSLETAIRQVVMAIDAWLTIAGIPPGKVDVICKWDDSLVVDAEKEREQDRKDVAMGAMQIWEYRMKYYGEDEATAKVNAAPPDLIYE